VSASASVSASVSASLEPQFFGLTVPKGFRLFGSVRSEEDATRLKKDFGQGYIRLVFDVTDAED
jgi:hypothetical protein